MKNLFIAEYESKTKREGEIYDEISHVIGNFSSFKKAQTFARKWYDGFEEPKQECAEQYWCRIKNDEHKDESKNEILVERGLRLDDIDQFESLRIYPINNIDDEKPNEIIEGLYY